MEVITLISAGFVATSFVAGWFIGQSIRNKKKFKDLQGKYDKRCKELTNALGEVGMLNSRIESFQKYNADLVERNKEVRQILASGFSLRVVDMLDFEKNIQAYNTVCIVAYSNIHPEVEIEIKRFVFDQGDLDDYEFARREAEELLETIQKF